MMLAVKTKKYLAVSLCLCVFCFVFGEGVEVTGDYLQDV